MSFFAFIGILTATVVFPASNRPHFSLDIKTQTTKGLILHVAGAGAIPLLALYIANGKIKMSLGQNRVIYHKQKSNDGNWHRVIQDLLKS